MFWRTGRLTRLTAAVLLCIITFGAASPARSAPPPRVRVVDLAAAALTPADLAAAGQAGFVFTISGAVGHAGEDSLAYWVGKWTDTLTDTQIQDRLEQTGLGRGYRFGLRLRQDPTNPRSDLARDVGGGIHEFADQNAAAAAFDLIQSEIANSNVVEEIEGAETVGDQSLLIRVPGAGATQTPDIAAVFRAGRLIATFRMHDYRGDEPAVADVAALAALLGEKMTAALGGRAPDLGNRVLRLAKDNNLGFYEVRRDQYLRLDGVDFPFDLEESDALAARAQSAGEAVDVYALNQFIKGVQTDPPLPSQVNWGIQLYRFANDAAAGAWLGKLSDRLAAGDDGVVSVTDVQPLENIPTLGDESAAYSYVEDPSDPSGVVRVAARVGATVADIRLTTFIDAGPPAAALGALAAAEVACLAGSGCASAATLADVLVGSSSQTGTAPARAAAALNLPAMALRPADLEAKEVQDHGMTNGLPTDAPATASVSVCVWRVDVDGATAAALRAADQHAREERL